MIERTWSARAATAANADAYLTYFHRVVGPELAAIAGFRGVRIVRRARAGGGVEVVVATRWASLDAIRAFAGDDIERAVVHDEAAALLSDYDRTVRHFEIVHEFQIPNS